MRIITADRRGAGGFNDPDRTDVEVAIDSLMYFLLVDCESR